MNKEPIKFSLRKCEWSVIEFIIFVIQKQRWKGKTWTTEGEQQSMHHNFNTWNCRNISDGEEEGM